MFSVLKNFVFVCFVVAIILFLGWFYIHNKGMQQTHKPFQSTYFSDHEKHELIALRGESQEFPENSLDAFRAAASLSPKIILWADVMMTQDGVPVVTRDQDLEKFGVTNSYVSLMSFADLQKVDAGYAFTNAKGETSFRGKGLKFLSLKELVQTFPNQRFVINFNDENEGIDQQVLKALDYDDKTQRFLITSERDKILKSVRKLAPMILYGASTPQLTQLLILTNLYLESATTIEADVLVVEKVSEHVRTSDRIHLNQKMIDEAHRRGIKVFAGNEQNDPQTLLDMKIDGIITSHISGLKTLIEKPDFGL